MHIARIEIQKKAINAPWNNNKNPEKIERFTLSQSFFNEEYNKKLRRTYELQRGSRLIHRHQES